MAKVPDYSATSIVFTHHCPFCKAVKAYKCISLDSVKIFFLITSIVLHMKSEICLDLHLIIPTASEHRLRISNNWIIPIITGIYLSY